MITRLFFSLTDSRLSERFGGTLASFADVEAVLRQHADQIQAGDVCYVTVMWVDQCNFELPRGLIRLICDRGLELAFTADKDESQTAVLGALDGTRQFRMDNGSITGAHGDIGAHVQLEIVNPARTGKAGIVVNNHVPIVE